MAKPQSHPDSEGEITLTAVEAAALRRGFKYCPRCRAGLEDREAFGRTRRVCPQCNFVQFIDPKVAVAVMALTSDNKVLLVKRAMEPARGSWCLPGGFMEIGETPQQTASREGQEETGLEIKVDRLLDVFYYEDYRGSGVLIMYRGQINGGTLQPGEDADEVGLFGPDELPADIAFETNVVTLAKWKNGQL